MFGGGAAPGVTGPKVVVGTGGNGLGEAEMEEMVELTETKEVG